jgi:hypothetical protein
VAILACATGEAGEAALGECVLNTVTGEGEETLRVTVVGAAREDPADARIGLPAITAGGLRDCCEPDRVRKKGEVGAALVEGGGAA